ncbi:dUTP diphosphatase [Sorangium sp. So ce1024]|uniref:dUTP diphosphatase n=1 Tax=Sorangium sp. So ce1024 TaxID=3133327 RepID=UPI003F51CBE8
MEERERPIVRVKRVGDPALPLPAYETDGAAGLDLRADLTLLRATPLPMGAAIRDGVLCLYPGTRLLIPCGIAFEIPPGWEGQVCGRSGWTGRGLHVLLGRVDSDYRGGVGIHVENRAGTPLEIRHADRIAQMVLGQAPQARIEEATELSATSRGANGYGHTGVR